MKKTQFYKGTKANIYKIFKVLKESHSSGEEFLTVSEIGRRSMLHKWTVSRVLDLYMTPFVDVVSPEALENVGLQVKLVKIKRPEMTIEQVFKYLKLRRKINQ